MKIRLKESEDKTYIKTVKGPNGTFFKIFKDKDGNYIDENNQKLDDQELKDYNLTEKEESKPNLVYVKDYRIDIDSQGNATVWKNGKIFTKLQIPKSIKADEYKSYLEYKLEDDDEYDYKSKQFKESNVSSNEIVKFMYDNYPDAAYIGYGKTSDGRTSLNFDRFPEEAINALFKRFGNKVTVRQSHSEYAPELKKTAVLINKDIKEAENEILIDFKNATNEELQNWLNKYNDRREHSEEFNALWLRVYKLLQRREEKELVTESEFEEIASKSVPDSDGFTTDYTMYKDLSDGKYVFIFGDKDLYRPEDEDYDYTADSEEEAKEWFNSYTGFDEAEGTQVTDIAKKEEYKNLVTPTFKLGKKINESYNYIGTDVDEEPRDNKSHKEKVFTVYDQYGEIGEYHTREEAQKVVDEWYNDPELYGEGGAQLRIEEDIIDVLNNKIVVPDDLAN